MSVTVLPSRVDRHRVRLDRQPLRQRSPARPAGGASLRSRLREVVGDALLVLVQRVGARLVVVPERRRLGNRALGELRARASSSGSHGRCGALWCIIRKNGLSRGRFVDELERQVGDDVGHVPPGVGLLAGRRVEHRIDVHALARQDLPAVEARRDRCRGATCRSSRCSSRPAAAAAPPSSASCRSG